ncbi:unnamed protein product [Adineta steineri]|uniref:Protein kinase domain-containing protein n=1 Tax=Adineta steineri TaxID=433720 RepID=A0A819CZR1_9BILA|nr:unnamed protein product [Adineta steineri]
MAFGQISYQASRKGHKQRYDEQHRSRSYDDLLVELANGGPPGSVRQRMRQANWSSLGSLNSFGESTTTPPSSQEHTGGSSGSNTNGSGQQRETLHSRFDFKQTLGKGTYGKVKLALDKRKNEQVAIKTIKKSRIENPHDLARIRREIDFMTSLNHPYIIRIKEGKGFYESREKIILVMEYASGGELYDYLNRMKRIPESQARAIFRQIVSAVHFLHKNQIVHRDLKLENILIDHNGDIKLADFGLSNNWSPRRLLHTFCGSPLYASPEIVSGIPYYGPEVDCWSLGVLLYTLVFGSMPFQGGDYNRLVRNITSGEFIQPREQSGALGLIRKCLTVLPSKRFTVDDVAAHWWVNLGYKYPPVHYYLTPAMKKTGLFISSHLPALTFNESNNINAMEANSKTIASSTPGFSHQFAQNGDVTDTQKNYRPISNGYHSIPRTHRLNSNNERTSNPSRRTSKERHHDTKSSKYPPRAFSLIQYCLKPDANTRATTKDILRHDWLVHGPVLSVRLNSTTTSLSLPITDQQITNDYDKIRLRSMPIVEKTLSPTNSLVELELHTSSFFDTARLRDKTSGNKEQQRRNRVSAIPIPTRYLSSNNNNNTKINSSSLTRPPNRRPVSLTFDDQFSNDDASTLQSINIRHSRRAISPTSTKTTPLTPTSTTTTTSGSTDRFHTQRYTLPASSNSSRHRFSTDLDSALNDFKSRGTYKYTPPKKSVAPTVFTTSTIKFAPAPIRRMSPLRDQEDCSSSHTAQLLNTLTSNPSCHIEDSINHATTSTNNNNRHSFLTSFELPTKYNPDKNHLLDDNNNLVSLKVYD